MKKSFTTTTTNGLHHGYKMRNDRLFLKKKFGYFSTETNPRVKGCVDVNKIGRSAFNFSFGTDMLFTFT